jgi:hypothetical protein
MITSTEEVGAFSRSLCGVTGGSQIDLANAVSSPHIAGHLLTSKRRERLRLAKESCVEFLLDLSNNRVGQCSSNHALLPEGLHSMNEQYPGTSQKISF